ncbi:hypothetical protein KEM48_003984 [Puccinia striiformis f. sp. tritici PST-130]|nr:hypothetical protein KEM48_003984 [Puccinia striiformis f. sp. tritici PST-130]
MACPTESIEQTISGHVSNLHGNPSFLPLQPILQPNLFYEQYNRYPFEKPQYDYVDGSSEIFEMNEANSYSSYLQSPESIPSGFSPLGYETTYGHRYKSDATTDYIGTPLGYPSSPTEYPFACNPSSTYSYQAASEFQTWSTLSPESINSVRSETVGVFPPPCMNNTSTSTEIITFNAIECLHGTFQPPRDGLERASHRYQLLRSFTMILFSILLTKLEYDAYSFFTLPISHL